MVFLPGVVVAGLSAWACSSPRTLEFPGYTSADGFAEPFDCTPALLFNAQLRRACLDTTDWRWLAGQVGIWVAVVLLMAACMFVVDGRGAPHQAGWSRRARRRRTSGTGSTP